MQPIHETSENDAPLWSNSWWKASGVIALGLIAGIGTLAIIVLLVRPFALLFLAISIAAALNPLVERIAKVIPHSLAIMMVIGAILLSFILFVVGLVPTLSTQLEEFIQQLPELVDRVQEFFNQSETLSALVDQFASGIGQIGQRLIEVPVSIVTAVFDAVLVLVVAIYLLLSASGIRNFILSLFGADTREKVDEVGRKMVKVAGGYIRGVAINVVVIGIITAVGLSIIGLPYAIVLGILAGLFEALPVVGSLVAAFPILLVALLESPTTFLITFAFVLLVQQLEGNVIAPNVMQHEASVPRFMVPLIVVAGGILFGVLGALIAVPFVAVLRVFILEVIVPFIRRQTGASVGT